jgi:hypothetical protein
MDQLERYLDQVCRSIGGPRSLRQHIRQELREHLLDAAAEHRRAGLPEEEALARALADFGGPEQLGSEFAVLHGHRLMAVVIDKAVEWKERTMKAKWLWSSWALLVVIGLIAMELCYITFSVIYLVPKFEYLSRHGWVQSDESAAAAFISWAHRFLSNLKAATEYTTWLVLALATIWGLFEWRVRSENKSFMRLAALGSIALGLMLVIALLSAALIIPLQLAIPEIMGHPPERILKERVDSIDASVDGLQVAFENRDWNALSEQTLRAYRSIDDLTRLGAAAQFRPQLNSAKKCLQQAQEAIARQDLRQLDAVLREFRKLYAPVREAAMTAGPKPPP